jgi:hypothetical protein
VVVPAPTMPPEARVKMAEQLKAVGFSEVTMVNALAQPSDATEPGERTVAA